MHYFLGNNDIWINLNRLANYNQWVTQPGTTATYFNWAQRQPKNNNVDNCAAISPVDGLKWKGKPCQSHAYFICEV